MLLKPFQQGILYFGEELTFNVPSWVVLYLKKFNNMPTRTFHPRRK